MMKRILLLAICLWGNLVHCQVNTKPIIRIGFDTKYYYMKEKNSHQDSIDCTAHEHFYNGLCRSKGNQTMVNYLTKAMEGPVEVLNFEDRAALLQEFYKGNLDFVFLHLNNFEKVIHTHGELTKPLLTVLESIDINSAKTAYYYANFIVKNNSGIKSIKDLRGKRIGLRCYSVSGSEVPYMLLKENHIEPSKETHLRYYPSNANLVEAFLKNELDAIVIWDYFFEHYQHKAKIKPNDFRIIDQYKIPDRVFAANSQKTTPKTQQQFVNAMLKMPKQNYIGLSFSGVTRYQGNDYRAILSLLKRYRQLHIKPNGCEKMTINKKPRVWSHSKTS